MDLGAGWWLHHHVSPALWIFTGTNRVKDTGESSRTQRNGLEHVLPGRGLDQYLPRWTKTPVTTYRLCARDSGYHLPDLRSRSPDDRRVKNGYNSLGLSLYRAGPEGLIHQRSGAVKLIRPETDVRIEGHRRAVVT